MTVFAPTAAVHDTVSVSVELWPAVTDAGLKLAETPDGSHPTDRETVSIEPLVTAVEMVT